MPRLFARLGLALIAVACCSLAQAAPAPPSARDFGREPALSSMSISPDGKHIAGLTSPDGVAVNLTVWKTDALTSPPVYIGSGRMRFIEVQFLKNDRLLVTAIQPLTYGDTRTHVVKSYVTDLQGENFRPLLPENRAGQGAIEEFVNRVVDANVISRLPLDPQYVMVEDQRLDGEGDVYRVNVYSGAAERVERAQERTFFPRVDLKGELRTREKLDYDSGNVFRGLYIKSPQTGRWEEHFRSYAKDRKVIEVEGFSTDPNIIYLRITPDGQDKAAIYEYDILQKKLVEPLFAHKMFEAIGVVQSDARQDYGQILGFLYAAETYRWYWADPQMEAVAKAVQQSLGAKMTTIDWTDPGGAGTAKIEVTTDSRVEIADWSDDRKLMLVVRSGPRQPTEYYLLSDGSRLQLLGRARPWIDPKALGETRLVQYPARDGLMIPAILTTPPKETFGAGPYPTLIIPHGGPWSRDYMQWDPSGWQQYFAARGFAILQPQFRGSEDWGQKLWRAGDAEWGQKMQDDKDDGVKWMVSQKIADPSRVAMFGYSYGGYAALAAAIRPGGLYQCAISGAGAGDLAMLGKDTYDNRYQREFQNPTIKGLDALDHAREASIPVFLYHGDRDQIVEVEQSRKFAAALRAAGKPYKLTEIKDMGHSYATMTPAMLEQQLVEVEAFLKSDCGPGGL